MKRLATILTCTLFPVLLLGNTTTDSLLKVLDETIERASFYSDQREAKLVRLRLLLPTVHTNQARYTVFCRMYTEYQSYKYDSAYVYAGNMLKTAQALNNPNRISESKIALAFSCVSAGLYKEATEISNSIDTAQLTVSYKARLYAFRSTLYMNMADFSAPEPYYSDYRENSALYCRNSIGLLKTGSSAATMVTLRQCQLQYDYPKATSIAEKYLSSNRSDLHDYAIVASMLGFFYQVQKDSTRAVEYFALAAIADIKLATKETSAIRQLAELLYVQGDIQHAYLYASLALNDANFYNARQRKIEVGRILPIIESGRFQIIKEQKDKLLIFSMLISVLLILFFIATFIIIKQNKKLNSARLMILQQNKDLLQSNEELTLVQKKISKQNIDLMHINEKLKETHTIKDEYIGYFFSTNSTYLEKMEEYRKLVARKVRNRQFEELIEIANSSDMRKEREDMFALFDQIFMKLFPDFVHRYNQLFNEEDRVMIKPDGILTPEIRIFALIRLGILDSERIANFLDFSLSTIKNYKTKVKNRSVIPNEHFEQKIMEIESVKIELSDKND
jgi:hypothetical protein